MSIQVGVRVRPFNTREKDQNSICDIQMTENQTIITDDAGTPKTFTFDHSFWSHDCYIEQENGYLSPDDSGKYADQALVFNVLGKQILDNAWQGYHCCLFAYGQTGSGKSYSMVGYGENKGIVPISCEEIFKRIANNNDESIHYEVEVSMLEIYNEKIQDLLVPISKRPQAGLKIHESKTLGVFVSDLTKYPVSSYEEISKKMEEGYENRTIGSTAMNNTSSRAHTIVCIEFTQVQKVGNTKSEKISKINLVDLAGSERAKSTEATGARLKEGCNINKSLLVLGNVINALADKCMGKKKNVLPPYRDSALTRILQNALGGNSKTVMICALSPASINYEETLSTLRYADRAKKIQNKAVVNESEHDKTVRLLREENNDLKKKIEQLSKKLLGNGGVVEEGDQEKFLELKAQYEQTQKLCETMSKSFNERLEEAKKNDKELGIEKVNISKPHLIVLNEDPQLSHKLKYTLENLPLYVGRKHGNPEPKIKLSGIGIKTNHAIFLKSNNDSNKILLKPNDNDSIKYIYINGKKLESAEGQELNHKDTIIFGTNSILLYMDKSDGKDIYDVDWESAQSKLQEEIDKQKKLDEIENEKKKMEEFADLKQIYEKQYNEYKQDMENKTNKKLQEYETKINQMESESIEKKKLEQERDNVELRLKERIEKLEIEKNNNKLSMNNKSSSGIVREEKEKMMSTAKLESILTNLLKKIYKMKILISDLKRKVDLDLFLTKDIIDYFNDPLTPLNIYIRVENYEEAAVYYWTQDTFHNKYDLMKELYNKFLEENYDISNLSHDEDPLWDEPKQSLLGYCFYKMEPIAYLMNNECNLPIISSNGEVQGYVTVDVVPSDLEGNLYTEIPESPLDLVGESLKITVNIKECHDLPDNFSKNLQIEYVSFTENTFNKTKNYNIDGSQTSFEINEKFEHKISYLTKEDITFFEKDKLCFKVYADETIKKKNKSLPPNREDIIKSHEDEEIKNEEINGNINNEHIKRAFTSKNLIQVKSVNAIKEELKKKLGKKCNIY